MTTPMRCPLLWLALFSFSQVQTAAAGRDQSQILLQEQISKRVAEERARNKAATEASQKRTPTAQQIANAQTRAEHEDLAVWYEQEARAAEEKADWHRRMLNDSYRPAYGSQYTGTYRDPGFLRHCENLVRRYDEVAQDTLALAKLHRQLAAEAK